MTKVSPTQKAEAAKINALAREANARAKAIETKNEIAALLRDALSEAATAVSGSPNREISHETLGSEKSLRRFGGGILMKIAPSTVDRFLVSKGGVIIPGEFWMLEEEEAVVTCPCGAEPRIPLGSIRPCDGGEDCKRVFFFAGRDVRSAMLSDEDLAVFAAPAEA